MAAARAAPAAALAAAAAATRGRLTVALSQVSRARWRRAGLSRKNWPLRIQDAAPGPRPPAAEAQVSGLELLVRVTVASE